MEENTSDNITNDEKLKQPHFDYDEMFNNFWESLKDLSLSSEEGKRKFLSLFIKVQTDIFNKSFELAEVSVEESKISQEQIDDIYKEINENRTITKDFYNKIISRIEDYENYVKALMDKEESNQRLFEQLKDYIFKK